MEDTTGAETLATTAEESSGEAEVTEEVTETVEADTQEDAEPAETQDGEEEGEGELKDRGKHQTTLEERVEQLVEKRLAALEAKRQAETKQVPELPTYVELDFEKVNLKRAELEDQITEFRMEGTEEGFRKAYHARKQLEALENAIISNIEAKEKYEAIKAQRAEQEKFIREFDEDAEFYRREHNIPLEVWQAGAAWMEDQLRKDPILVRKFQERARRLGSMDTIEWLHKMAEQGLKAKQEAVQTKDVAKKKQVAGTGGSAPAVKSDEIRPGMDIKEFVRIRNAQEMKERYG